MLSLMLIISLNVEFNTECTNKLQFQAIIEQSKLNQIYPMHLNSPICLKLHRTYEYHFMLHMARYKFLYCIVL